MLVVRPGDVLCTRTPTGWPGKLIRFGAALLDRPNTANHVIVAHHVDAGGVPWGIEGRPGGVGWVDLRPHLASSWTVANVDQPKTEPQRGAICAAAEGLLGTPYDWAGIALDGMEAIHADRLWQSHEWGPKPPAHVVCSSLADWTYDVVGLASPGGRFDRTVTPGDWVEFIMLRRWLPAMI